MSSSRSSAESFVTRLRRDLADVLAGFLEVVGASSIVNIDPNSGGPSGIAFVGYPEWGWATSSPELTRHRMAVLGEYRAWRQRLDLLFPHPAREVSITLKQADELVGSWLERTKSSHDVPGSINAAHEAARGVFISLDALLDLGATGDETLRLVPDTNALLANADLSSYAGLVSASRYEIVLLPTVLRELDELKDRGRTPELRQKAQSVVRRIKGLRDRGSLPAGVQLTQTMRVRAEHRDVDPSTVLEWLTGASADDQILAGALKLQGAHPQAGVVLVTRDLNLQNKCDVAGLATLEPPPDPALSRARLKAAIAYRRSGEHPDGVVAQATLTNQGPFDATDVEYQLRSADPGPIKVTSGPWKVAMLAPDESVSHDIALLSSGDAVIAATWTDGSGERGQEWTVAFPPRPAAAVRPTRTPRR